MFVVHISDVTGTKRTRLCDGTPNLDAVPSGDTKTKILCEKCRETFLSRKRK